MKQPDALRIPFNRPTRVGSELASIGEVIAGNHWAGSGTFSARCELALVGVTASKAAFLTTSCTDALEMSALLLDIKPGDEVICPSFTFVSTLNAFVLRGAKPIFADVRADTMNLDERQLPSLIGPATKAVVAVHYAGVGCAMDEILAICRQRGVAVVEDNAHGLFGSYKERPLGSFGAMAAQSFHETKNITCGEGGALIVNDEQYIPRADIIREKGTDRSRFARGEIDKYTWRDVGSSFLPSEVLAAVLWVQLQESDSIQGRRSRIWDAYYESLLDWSHQTGFRLPVVPLECQQAYHMFYMLCPTPESRDRFIRHLASASILAVSHYVPLNTSPFGLNLGGEIGMCPVTEDVSGRLVRLPIYTNMTEEDMAAVIAAVMSFTEV